MCTEEKSICFSGHRTERLPKSRCQLGLLEMRLHGVIEQAIDKGYHTFYFGACYGFDLLCANAVLLRKKFIKFNDPQQIRLIAVVPFEEQATHWNEYYRNLYFETLAQCDEVITLHSNFKVGCYHERNRYMVDHSRKLICYYDGGMGGTVYIVHYAKRRGISILNLYEK